MYSTCLFCRASLGANQVIERFPVGRRLAFDAERGRLWAVCPRCRRWNLAPLEERWEAVEECERLYPRTRLQVSTEQVGMARLADGTDLVRIGRPVRAELAAWRWGSQFLQRARRAKVVGNALTGLDFALAIVAMPLFASFAQPFVRVARGEAERIVRRHLSTTHVPTADGVLVLRGRHVATAALVPAEEGGWGLSLPHTRGGVVLTGYPALGASRFVLARLNHAGGEEALVSAAVGRLERAETPEAHFGAVARTVLAARERSGDPGLVLGDVPAEVLLSLEMAASEEAERRAMEGELGLLEREWREAEEVAAIADALLLPGTVDERLEGLRGGGENG